MVVGRPHQKSNKICRLISHLFNCNLTFPSQQKRGHGFFRLMLDDNTTSSCNSIFRRRHWLLHFASRKLVKGSSLRMQCGAKRLICGGVNNRSALPDKQGEFPLNTPLYLRVLNRTRRVPDVKRSAACQCHRLCRLKKKKLGVTRSCHR